MRELSPLRLMLREKSYSSCGEKAPAMWRTGCLLLFCLLFAFDLLLLFAFCFHFVHFCLPPGYLIYRSLSLLLSSFLATLWRDMIFPRLCSLRVLLVLARLELLELPILMLMRMRMLTQTLMLMLLMPRLRPGRGIRKQPKQKNSFSCLLLLILIHRWCNPIFYKGFIFPSYLGKYALLLLFVQHEETQSADTYLRSQFRPHFPL